MVTQPETYEGTWYVAVRQPGGFWGHLDPPHGAQQTIHLEPGTYRMILILPNGQMHPQSSFTLNRKRSLNLRTFVRDFQSGGLLV